MLQPTTLSIPARCTADTERVDSRYSPSAGRRTRPLHPPCTAAAAHASHRQPPLSNLVPVLHARLPFVDPANDATTRGDPNRARTPHSPGWVDATALPRHRSPPRHVPPITGGLAPYGVDAAVLRSAARVKAPHKVIPEEAFEGRPWGPAWGTLEGILVAQPKLLQEPWWKQQSMQFQESDWGDGDGHAAVAAATGRAGEAVEGPRTGAQ